jgi:hypothetical protein
MEGALEPISEVPDGVNRSFFSEDRWWKEGDKNIWKHMKIRYDDIFFGGFNDLKKYIISFVSQPWSMIKGPMDHQDWNGLKTSTRFPNYPLNQI